MTSVKDELIKELTEALEIRTDEGNDLTNYSCHKGLVLPEKCSRCGVTLKHRKLLNKARMVIEGFRL